MEASVVEIAILIFVGMLLLVPLFIRLITAMLAYRQESRYLRMEMQRAETEEERVAWQRALTYARLCLIPFVTAKNVRSVYRFFHKKEKMKEEKNHAAHAFLPAVLCIVLCMASLCGMTFAWFSASSGSRITEIQTATYRVTVTAGEEDGAELEAVDGKYTLAAGKTYVFVLAQDASSTASTGYCVVTLTGADSLSTVLYADPVNKTGMTFRVTPEADMTVSFDAVWGKLPSAVPDDSKIGDGDTVGNG